MKININTTIDSKSIKRSEQVLRDNGIADDEASTVLQAILDTELSPESN